MNQFNEGWFTAMYLHTCIIRKENWLQLLQWQHYLLNRKYNTYQIKFPCNKLFNHYTCLRIEVFWYMHNKAWLNIELFVHMQVIVFYIVVLTKSYHIRNKVLQKNKQIMEQATNIVKQIYSFIYIKICESPPVCPCVRSSMFECYLFF